MNQFPVLMASESESAVSFVLTVEIVDEMVCDGRTACCVRPSFAGRTS